LGLKARRQLSIFCCLSNRLSEHLWNSWSLVIN
jgi:hypothetical protein